VATDPGRDTGRARLLAVVAFLELLVKIVVPEFGLGVGFPFYHVLIVQLALDLAVQNLKVLVRHHREICREVVVRRQVKFVRHGSLSRP
jgi:hypothetical protein